MNRRQLLKASAALSIIPFADKVLADKLENGKVKTFAKAQSEELKYAKYWSVVAPVQGPQDEEYFDIVEYHNYLVGYFQHLQGWKPNGIQITHARIQSRPESFSKASQGLIWTDKPMEELIIDLPDGLILRTYHKNQILMFDPAEIPTAARACFYKQLA